MKPRDRKASRRGFAMILILVFLTVILGIWGVVGRHTASMLRIEQARADRVERDAAKAAFAHAVASLEAGEPRKSPFIRKIKGRGERWFTVVFVRDPNEPKVWTVSVTPGDGGFDELTESDFVADALGPGT